MIPLIICSSLLILLAVVVVGGDVTGGCRSSRGGTGPCFALPDINNHMVVVLLWFVPLSVALLATRFHPSLPS